MVIRSDRVGIEPRRQARLRTQRVLLSKPMLMVTVVLLAWVVAVLVGGWALLSVTGHSWSPSVFGFLLGSAIASVFWSVWMVATQVDGSWSWRVGAMAERHTSEVVKHLGPQWRLRYNMVFYGGRIDDKTWITDIDCVAIGPGGILAVSTKWTSDHWDLNDPTDEWLLAAARVAANNAERLSHPLRPVIPEPPIIPIVVCWGPGVEPITAGFSKVKIPGRRYGDVRIVHGSQLSDWLRRLPADRVDTDTVAALDRVVGSWIADHENRHRRTVEVRSKVEKLVSWANRSAIGAAALGAAAVAWWIAAVFSRQAARALSHFAHFGSGTGAIIYLFAPVLLPAAAAIAAHRASARARQARLPGRSGYAYLAIGSATAWVLTFISTALLL